MSEASVIQLSRPEVYVNSISFGGTDAVAASLSNDFIHLVDLENKKSKSTLDVAKKVVGIHFDLRGSPILRAIDDSYSVHIFDIRSGSKKKSRLNTVIENHTVVATAVSDQYIAIASSTFLETEKEKKQKKRLKCEEKGKEYESDSSDSESDEESSNYDHVISIFDIRASAQPLLTIKKSHDEAVNHMSFMKDGRHLITGGGDGLINIFDVSLSKEDIALQSSNNIGSSLMKVGFLSKRMVYGITDDNKCALLSPNTPDDVDFLFSKSAGEGKFLVDLLKGGTEDRPVAMLECDREGKLYLSTVSVEGDESEIVEEWTGHTDIVRSSAFNNNILVTGGEDGKLVVKNIDLRPAGGGSAKKEKKEKKDKDTPKKEKKDKKKDRKEPY